MLELVAQIPPAQVVAYGDLAAMLGSRAARQVGRIMATSAADVPWWRVVRSSGHPPARHAERARSIYRAEGTPLVNPPTGSWRVDIDRCRWHGPDRS
ncbi:MAG TPA: MGMT family protein [Candidatus Lumbricidophila sp.]|nr:MGMT family protein [Candidatus Lumbricidophila sp.]